MTNNQIIPRLYPVWLLALGVACSSGGDSDNPWGSWEALIDTVGDTITVHTVSGNVWGDTMVLEPELSIGVLEGADEEMFGSVRSLAVTDSGEILIVDAQVPAIRRFSPDGRYLGDIGREGSGPGEYKRPASISPTVSR
ncbi:MAG: 6-bladed beta-propeller [Gemmatimonadales bacterium]